VPEGCIRRLLALLAPRWLAHLEKCPPCTALLHTTRGARSAPSPRVRGGLLDVNNLLIFSPTEDYEVLDATALGGRLGFKRDTVLAYLSRRNFRRIPRPNRLLAMGPIRYEMSVREWEDKEEGQRRGK
jgi:hypothetical protein